MALLPRARRHHSQRLGVLAARLRLDLFLGPGHVAHVPEKVSANGVCIVFALGAGPQGVRLLEAVGTHEHVAVRREAALRRLAAHVHPQLFELGQVH